MNEYTHLLRSVHASADPIAEGSRARATVFRLARDALPQGTRYSHLDRALYRSQFQRDVYMRSGPGPGVPGVRRTFRTLHQVVV